MSWLTVLLLGIGLGLRHATDADHVVVVSALIQREPGPWRAARVAALWGAGHTVTFLALGLAIVLAGVRLPPRFELASELLVAAMLIGFGLWHLAGGGEHEHGRSAARPVLIGLVHGLAGSAGIALLAATTIDSRPLAVLYLALVALGTVFGMVALTVLMSRPIGWTMQHQSLRRRATAIAALLSIALGISVLAQALATDHAS
jgi:nickel/cobalt exporter